jgi:peptide-methionine (S)-S-oxide reductase
MPWWSPRSLLRRFGHVRRTEVATFATGCFRGVEAEFRVLDGVIDPPAGYTGGFTPDPSYEQVCAGQTGHAEAMRVIFAPTRVSYEALLATFWQVHDPTQIGHQGFDIGEQYRSAVFTHSSEPARLALDPSAREQRLRTRPIATEVLPVGPSYLAEPSHQRLYEREGGPAPGRYALSELKSWLALADPEDRSRRNGVTHESGDSRSP